MILVRLGRLFNFIKSLRQSVNSPSNNIQKLFSVQFSLKHQRFYDVKSNDSYKSEYFLLKLWVFKNSNIDNSCNFQCFWMRFDSLTRFTVPEKVLLQFSVISLIVWSRKSTSFYYKFFSQPALQKKNRQIIYATDSMLWQNSTNLQTYSISKMRK